jgi:hypothetical protein
MVMAEKKPSFMKGKYTEDKDKKKDAAMTKAANLSKSEKAKFDKMDDKHKKPKTMGQDKKEDAKIINKIKSQRTNKKAK